jgi:hypothetical protein
MDFTLVIKNSEIKIIEDAIAYLASPVPIKLPLHLELLTEDKWQAILALFHQLEDERMEATLH